MKKIRNKKIFMLIGIFAFVFLTFIVSANALTFTVPSYTAQSSEKSHADIMKELGLTKEYGDDYEKYLENNERQADIGRKINSLIKEYYGDYPSYYGGVYISHDSFNLIIQVVEKNLPKERTEEYSFYNEIINMESAIKVEYVKYSFNELTEIYDKIKDSITNSDNKVKTSLSSFGVDSMKNTVTVEFTDNSKENQEYFKKNIVNSELITFDEGTNNGVADLKPGGLINFPGQGCSMGFRTKYNGKEGYMSAGHCAYYATYGTVIATGTIIFKNFANYTLYDYSWVETNSSWTPTNNLAYTATGITKLAVVNYCPQIIAGMAVAKSGYKTQYTPGVISSQGYVSVQYDKDYNYTIVYNLMKSTVNSWKGDSGGPMFIPRTDANGGSIPIGIVNASGGDGANISYFTSINDLPTSLQTGRY